MKMPPGIGFWTGFWLNPSDGTHFPEIDAMEHLGSEPPHLIEAYHRSKHQVANFTYNDFPRSMESGWHTYAVEWQPNTLHWYVDGIQVQSFTSCLRGSTLPHKWCGSVMKKAMSLNLTFAMSSDPRWGLPVTGKTRFPSTVLVDYVRVWQKGL